MDNRNQWHGARETINMAAGNDAPKVQLTPPTEEEERYLQSIERSSSEYSREIILGGPRAR